MIPKPAKNLQFFTVIKLIFSCFELNTDPEFFPPLRGSFHDRHIDQFRLKCFIPIFKILSKYLPGTLKTTQGVETLTKSCLVDTLRWKQLQTTS